MATRISDARSRRRSRSGGRYLRRRQAIPPWTSRSSRTTCANRSRALTGAGSPSDEAFLVAVKRMGAWTSSRRSSPASTRTGCGSSSWSPRAPRRRGAEARGRRSSPSRSRSPQPCSSRCRRCSGSSCDDARRLLRPQRRFFGAAAPHRLLRVEAAARRRGTVRWLAAAFVLAAVFVNAYPFARTATPSCSPRCTCRSRSGSSSASRTPVALAAGARPDGLRPLHRRALHLLRADRARRRRPRRSRGHVQASASTRSRSSAVAAAVRRGRGGRRRVLAGRGEAERHREHGAGADAALHAALRRDARSPSSDHARDRERDRHRARRADRLRPAAGAGPRPVALLDLGPRLRRARRGLRLCCSCCWWSARSWPTRWRWRRSSARISRVRLHARTAWPRSART